MGGGADYDNYRLASAFRDGLKSGVYDEALVDDKVRRILTVMDAIGMLDEAPRPAGAMNTPEHQDAVRRIAREGMVLLKNDDSLLPFDRGTIKTLAVIGENADIRHASGGGSAEIKALYEVTPLQALKEMLPDVDIRYAKGYPVDPAGLQSPDVTCLGADAAGVRGWQAAYFDNMRMRGDPVLNRTEGAVNYAWTEAPVGEMRDFSAIWTSTLTAPEAGTYTFMLSGTDCSILTIDGAAVLNIWGNSDPMTLTHTMELEQGQSLDITIRHNGKREQPMIRFGWIPPSQRDASTVETADAVALAREADAVLFVGGLTHLQDKEGSDRTDMRLPCGQDSLIEQLADANDNLAVVLVGGAAVEMPWADRVKAILCAWYAGSEGGRALVDLLFGEVSPCGKLPVSFYRRLQDCPAHAEGDYKPDCCTYREGIFVGYRYLDATGIEPLFPFGHGLSYTSFAYSDLDVEDSCDGAVTVSCRVRNTGDRAGADVIQVYVGKADSAVPRPPRELKGFHKVFLEPGDEKAVAVTLTQRDLSYYDVQKGGWLCESGTYQLYVGSSSRDVRLEGGFHIDS
jgi:beta-glucosidase